MPRTLESRPQASSSISKMSSRMEPMNARFDAVSSESNFFHSTPGISIRSKLPTLIHCLPRVTPGLLAALARVVPAKELMKVDLPAPFSPIRARISPFFNCSVTSFSAITPGYSFLICCNCNTYSSLMFVPCGLYYLEAEYTASILSSCYRSCYYIPARISSMLSMLITDVGLNVL